MSDIENMPCPNCGQPVGAIDKIERLREALAASEEREACLTTEQLASGEVVLLTQGQIDAAWTLTGPSAYGQYAEDVVRIFNIIACSECGGSGVVREHERGYEDGVEDTCPSCHGHKWKKT